MTSLIHFRANIYPLVDIFTNRGRNKHSILEKTFFEQHIAQGLLEIKAVKLSVMQPFTWASGIVSPIYCDNRIALSHPHVRTLIKQGLAEASAQFADIDVIAGIATAGIPHGALLADVLGKPFAYVRSSAKDHGRQHLIEGEIPSGARVLLVEDLISTGGSVLKAVDAVEAAGAQVIGVLAIFTYSFDKAKLAFEARNIPVVTLTNYPTLTRIAAETGYIHPNDAATLEQWRDNPEGWSPLYA
jgi:orotate phosphoribosyltransferase